MMHYYLVKVDHYITQGNIAYNPIETTHLLATEDIDTGLTEVLADLWVDTDKEVFSNWVSFFKGEVRCEVFSVKEIDETTFNLLKGLGL